MIRNLLLVSAVVFAGCATDPDLATEEAALSGSCGLGDEVVAAEVLTPASIPALSPVRVAQIIAAVRESAHTDVTTIAEAFDRVDDHEFNLITLDNSQFGNQFYTEIEFGAGGNSYGAIFYWGTAVEAAAIHDGFQEECGPVTFNYDQGDIAPACHGFLDYVNTASFATLDAYLPSNVAQAIVDARATAPFASIASVFAVDGVAETRLQQLLMEARAAGAVGADCSGFYDQVGVSTAEAAAMVALVNEVSGNELHGVLAFLINEQVIDRLLAARPFAGAAGISAVSGVGPATFRALRNAATRFQPWEELVGAVSAIDHPDGQVRIDLHFDWAPIAANPGDHVTSMSCFDNADTNELLESVGEAVALANAFDDLTVDPAAGLTDLERRNHNAHFFGCHIQSHPNPWVYDATHYFVNTQTGASVLITTHYVE